MESFPIIISSPSGGGKTTIVNALLAQDKNLSRVITATTRAPRSGEKNGKDYHFWPKAKFETAIKNKQMAEWAKVHVDYYGVPKACVDEVLKKGKCPVLVIDVQGAKTIRKHYKDAVSIFIAPPSFKTLASRIKARNDNTKDVKIRLNNAKEEMKQAKFYDYVVVNDVLPKAITLCQAIIIAEHQKTKRKDLKVIK
ncbi:MAG: guanylate kinase [Elusimicrobiota bacterium]|jgi:guanylate kinase|nr:guanylate kinase [Elusimicrobiota bacterium]